MTWIVALVSVLAAGDPAVEPTAATVFVTRGNVASDSIGGVRTQMAEAFLAAGLQTKDVGTVQGKRGEDMRACFTNTTCLERLSGKLGATHLVLVSIAESEGMYSAEVSTWTAGLDPHSAQIGASTADEVGFSVARTAGWALGRMESQLRARDRTATAASTTDSGEVPPADPRADESAPETVASTESIAGELPRERDGQVTLDQLMGEAPAVEEAEEKSNWSYREEAPSQSFALQAIAGAGLLPVQHNRTYLEVGDTLVRNNVGVVAAALGVSLRLPWSAVPDLYQTNVVAYGFDSTLLILTIDVGLEKRWPLLNGLLAPLLGGSLNVALLGLPVPDGNGERLATAWAAGFFAYTGAAVSLHERVAIHLHAGYRHSMRKAAQFSAGGDVYYARDAHGDTWKLYLGGVMARLGVSFEF